MWTFLQPASQSPEHQQLVPHDPHVSHDSESRPQSQQLPAAPLTSDMQPNLQLTLDRRSQTANLRPGQRSCSAAEMQACARTPAQPSLPAVHRQTWDGTWPTGSRQTYTRQQASAVETVASGSGRWEVSTDVQLSNPHLYTYHHSVVIDHPASASTPCTLQQPPHSTQRARTPDNPSLSPEPLEAADWNSIWFGDHDQHAQEPAEDTGNPVETAEATRNAFLGLRITAVVPPQTTPSPSSAPPLLTGTFAQIGQAVLPEHTQSQEPGRLSPLRAMVSLVETPQQPLLNSSSVSSWGSQHNSNPGTPDPFLIDSLQVAVAPPADESSLTAAVAILRAAAAAPITAPAVATPAADATAVSTAATASPREHPDAPLPLSVHGRPDSQVARHAAINPFAQASLLYPAGGQSPPTTHSLSSSNEYTATPIPRLPFPPPPPRRTLRAYSHGLPVDLAQASFNSGSAEQGQTPLTQAAEERALQLTASAPAEAESVTLDPLQHWSSPQTSSVPQSWAELLRRLEPEQ